MLITVEKSRLVLGRTIYFKGDVFDCREAEAKMLVAVGIATVTPKDAKATKEPPKPPTTGLSIKPGGPPASKEAPAPRVARQSTKPVPTPVIPVSATVKPVLESQASAPLSDESGDDVPPVMRPSTSSSFTRVPAEPDDTSKA